MYVCMYRYVCECVYRYIYTHIHISLSQNKGVALFVFDLKQTMLFSSNNVLQAWGNKPPKIIFVMLPILFQWHFIYDFTFVFNFYAIFSLVVRETKTDQLSKDLILVKNMLQNKQDDGEFFPVFTNTTWVTRAVLEKGDISTRAIQFSSVQLLSHVWLLVTPWTAACQASLSFTISWNLLKVMCY